jgi:hypothetical protein
VPLIEEVQPMVSERLIAASDEEARPDLDG